MKKLVSCFILALTLNSCAVYDAMTMAKFDNNEYGLITRIKTIAETAECGNKDSIAESAKKMWVYTVEFKNYTQYIPSNQKSFEVASKLSEITMGLHNKHGEMSTVYCEEKLKIIIRTTEDIQKSLGSKPR